MSLGKQNLATLYLFLLTLSIYTPNYGVLDKMTIQNFLISITNVLTLISIPIIFKEASLAKPFKHPLVILFFGYIGVGILSMIKSINVIESFVRLGQVLTFGLTLFLLIFFIQKKLIKLNIILIIIASTLLIDLYFSLKEYLPYVLNNIPYTYDDNSKLVGLYGNRNILATVLSFKVPLLIILANKYNKRLIYFLVFIVIAITFYNIMLLSSRATYLAIIISIVLLIIVSLYKYVNDKNSLIKSNKLILTLYFLPLFIAYFISTTSIDSSDQGNVLNRVSTITSADDTSKNTRLRYYSQSLEHLIKNPFLGGGIGNWKILSIKYDSKNIENYIIPYNAHNDILEAAAETGFIGALLFLSFFLLLLYYILVLLYKNIFIGENYQIYVLLTLPFIIYFIDLNLNFPSSRPSNQYFYLLYLSIILILKNIEDEKN